jgi:TonB family protein
MRSLFLIVLLLLVRGAGFGADKKPAKATSIFLGDLSNFQLRELTIWVPRPEYPAAARQKRLSGRGFFRLYVQVRTGVVARVEMASSTGSPILDRFAVDTFMRWRFKPPIVRQYQRLHDPSDTSEELVFVAPIAYAPPN